MNARSRRTLILRLLDVGILALDDLDDGAHEMGLPGLYPPLLSMPPPPAVVARDRKPSTGGSVYLIRSEGGLYKIGATTAKNVQRRIGSLQTGSAQKLELVHNIPTGHYSPFSLESLLHRRFARQRTRGEWFELNDSDVEYLKELRI